MKSCILLCFCFLFSHVSYSQKEKISISTNLLNLAVGGPSLAVSYKQFPRLAFQLYGSYGRFNYLPASETYKFKTAILDVKYSLAEFLYVGPYVRYIQKDVKREGYVDNTGFFSVS